METSQRWRRIASLTASCVLSACGGGTESDVGMETAAALESEQTALTQDPPLTVKAPWPVYTVRELNALGSGASIATALNNRNQVIGITETASGPRATLFGLWNKAALDLDALGSPLGQPTAINERAQVVGYQTYFDGSDTRFDPILLNLGSRSVVPLVGIPGTLNGAVRDINEWGKVVGQVWTSSGGYNPHAVVFGTPSRKTIELKALPGAEGAYAYGINDLGLIVGFSVFSDFGQFWRATLYRPWGGAVDLGLLNGGYESVATAINNKGQAIGYTRFLGPVAPYTRATLFNVFSGRLANLDTLTTDLSLPGSVALDINNKGQVVGGVSSPLGGPFFLAGSGFLWQEGSMKMLDSLLAPGLKKWHIANAAAINDDGRIAAVGVEFATGRHRALLLTPVN
jgi:uncharacterized membrane protein